MLLRYLSRTLFVVLAGAAACVAALAPLLEELHGANPRLAGWCVHADELVEELE